MTFRSFALAPVAVIAAALLALPVLAQTTAPAAPAADAPVAAEEAGPFVAATHQAWQVVCNRIDEAGTEICEMYQLLLDPAGAPIAEISIAALPLGAEFAAGATVTTPLETFLPTGMGFRIGEAETARVEPFRVCTVVGCVVRMGITIEEVDLMKAGSQASILIAPFVAIDQPVEITISLSGFTAALSDLQTRLSLAAAASRANP